MPNHTKPQKKTNVNTNVSEYTWDLKTKRYKRSPDYHSGNTATRLIFWAALVLILLIAVVWRLKN